MILILLPTYLFLLKVAKQTSAQPHNDRLRANYGQVGLHIKPQVSSSLYVSGLLFSVSK